MPVLSSATSPSRARIAGLGLLGLASLLWVSAAWAQYKIVGPDGRITYTDRPPSGVGAQKLGAAPTDSSGASGLPYALAQVAQRYPVRLYTTANCPPCDAARQSLRQRGVPHSEVTIERNEDVAEMLRAEGTRELPLLRIGAQRVVGWQAEQWQSYLDAAGYPSSSALPTTYRWPASQPLVPVAAVNPAPQATGPATNAQPASPNPGDAGPARRFRF